MGKKSLFNKYEAYTPKGGELSDEIFIALRPMVKEWADMGYSVKDIESIFIDVITMLSCTERMIRAMKLAKKEKKRVNQTKRIGG